LGVDFIAKISVPDTFPISWSRTMLNTLE
jgi:hypothetical protein